MDKEDFDLSEHRLPEGIPLIEGRIAWKKDEQKAILQVILRESGLDLIYDALSDSELEELQILLDNRLTSVPARVEQELVLALLYFSKGNLTPPEAQELSSRTLSKVDINNRYISHKGINWLAKFVLHNQT